MEKFSQEVNLQPGKILGLKKGKLRIMGIMFGIEIY
jgi:hypothetical protein